MTCSRCNERPAASRHVWCKTCKNRAQREQRAIAGRPALVGEALDREIARRMVRAAVRSGRIVKPDACEACGRIEVLHGHHVDYARPLDVVFCCAWCHRGFHLRRYPQAPRLRRYGT